MSHCHYWYLRDDCKLRISNKLQFLFTIPIYISCNEHPNSLYSIFNRYIVDNRFYINLYRHQLTYNWEWFSKTAQYNRKAIKMYANCKKYPASSGRSLWKCDENILHYIWLIRFFFYFVLWWLFRVCLHLIDIDWCKNVVGKFTSVSLYCRRMRRRSLAGFENFHKGKFSSFNLSFRIQLTECRRSFLWITIINEKKN